MNGTIIAVVKIYYANGTLAFGAVTGDKVTGTGGTINTLTRNGVKKLDGDYRIATIDAVLWDISPEVPPTPETPLYRIEFYADGRLYINGTLHT